MRVLKWWGFLTQGGDSSRVEMCGLELGIEALVASLNVLGRAYELEWFAFVIFEGSDQL